MSCRCMPRLYPSVFLLVLVTLTGCTTARLAYRDPGLTRDALEQGRLGIGAVTALGGGEYLMAPEMSEAMTAHLLEARPWLPVVGLPEMRQGFAPGEYGQLISNVVAYGEWTDSAMAAFGAASNHVRFVLVIDVVEGEWSRHRSVERRGWSGQCGVVTTSRGGSACMLFLVYDLERGKTVLAALGKASAGDSSRHFSHGTGHTTRMRVSPLPVLVPMLDKLGSRIANFLPS